MFKCFKILSSQTKSGYQPFNTIITFLSQFVFILNVMILLIIHKYLFHRSIFFFRLTGLCQKRHNELLVAVEQAKDMGLISFDIPFREYDYSEYMKN